MTPVAERRLLQLAIGGVVVDALGVLPAPTARAQHRRVVVSDAGQFVELAAGDPTLLTEMIGLANSLAAEYADGDFRLVFNTGEGAGQTVFHVHAHVLAGGLSEGSLRG